MASAINCAIDNDLIRLVFRAASDNGIEFVNTTSCNWLASIRSTAGPESTACVAQAEKPAAPFSEKSPRPFHQLSRRIDQIVHQQAMPSAHFADDVHYLGDVRFLPPLIDAGQWRAQPFGKRTRPLHAPRIRRYHR